MRNFINLIISIPLLVSLNACSSDEIIPSSHAELLPSFTIQEYYMDVYGDSRDHIKNFNWFTYDTEDRLTEIRTLIERGGKNEAESKKSISYDTNGNIIQIKITQKNPVNDSTEYIVQNYNYNSDKITVTQGDSITGLLELNEKKQLIKYTWFDSRKNPITYQYEYDNHGNLLTYTYQSESHKQTSKYTTERMNGIYKCINTPQWYIVLYYNNSLLNNPTEEYSSVNNSKFEKLRYYQYQYNKDGYPVYQDILYTPGWIGGSNITLKIEYIPATKTTDS